MPGALSTATAADIGSEDLSSFQRALARFPDGYAEGTYLGRRWGATVKRSPDHRRIWLFAEELGGTDMISFNLYLLSKTQAALKPCEMSNSKVVEFVLGFVPGISIE